MEICSGVGFGVCCPPDFCEEPIGQDVGWSPEQKRTAPSSVNRLQPETPAVTAVFSGQSKDGRDLVKSGYLDCPMRCNGHRPSCRKETKSYRSRQMTVLFFSSLHGPSSHRVSQSGSRPRSCFCPMGLLSCVLTLCAVGYPVIIVEGASERESRWRMSVREAVRRALARSSSPV